MRIQKRINHTNRKRIAQERVAIALNESRNSFDATIDLSGLDLPATAPVYVEPYLKHSYMRFDFGTVGNIAPPTDRVLTEVDATGGILFRIKVVDHEGYVGKVLALAHKIRPKRTDGGQEREALLHVRERALGEQLWRLDTEVPDQLELVVNNQVPGVTSLVKHDPTFQALILPAVLRSALVTVLEEFADDEDEPIGWAEKWKAFGEGLTGEEAPISGDEQEKDGWVEDAVSAFCDQHKFCARLVRKLTVSGE